MLPGCVEPPLLLLPGCEHVKKTVDGRLGDLITTLQPVKESTGLFGRPVLFVRGPKQKSATDRRKPLVISYHWSFSQFCPGILKGFVKKIKKMCVCVCVQPWTKGFPPPLFLSYMSRGMERTCEAPSNEAPHMILGYRQGRLPTYLQSTVAHAVHSFGLIHGFSCAPSPKQVSHCSFQPPVHCSQPRE